MIMSSRKAKKSKKKKRRIVPEVSPVAGKKKSRKYTAKLLPEEFLFTKREIAYTVAAVVAMSTSFNAILFVSIKLGLVGLVCSLVVAALGFSELRKDLIIPIWVIVFEAMVGISVLVFLWYSKEIGALLAQGVVLILCIAFIIYAIYYRKEEHREKFRGRLERWEDNYYARERKKMDKRQRHKRAKV
jgi:magnesium-transporting ATPase (P-type)